jgi:SAM-dependent methyltransferase
VSRLTRWWRRAHRARVEARRLRIAEEDARTPDAGPDGRPVPPPVLRTRVAGVPRVSHYLAMGERIARDVIRRLREAGADPAGFRRILDFGCGCARVARNLPALAPSAALVGVDVDADAVAWCSENLGDLGAFETVPHHPPTTFPSASFDVIVAVSVLTHLPPDMQRAWTAEWARLLAPGGHLLLTLSHESLREKFARHLELVCDEGGSSYHRLGPQEGHPDWYQVTYHSEAAARALVAPHFEVRRIRRRGVNRHQMSVVCRRV